MTNNTVVRVALFWPGGAFSAQFFSDLDPEIGLLTFAGANLLGSAMGTNFTLSIGNVPAGNYLLQVSSLFPESYVVLFSQQISAVTTVQESPSVLLFMIGLAIACLVRLRQSGKLLD